MKGFLFLFFDLINKKRKTLQFCPRVSIRKNFSRRFIRNKRYCNLFSIRSDNPLLLVSKLYPPSVCSHFKFQQRSQFLSAFPPSNPQNSSISNIKINSLFLFLPIHRHNEKDLQQRSVVSRLGTGQDRHHQINQ